MNSFLYTKYLLPEDFRFKEEVKPIPKDDGISKNSVIRTFTTFGSVISIGFGIWHFFIPDIWNWYSFIDKTATELVIAIRAINIFFSLLLVLLGTANILIVFRKSPDRFSTSVILTISTILWATRLILQIVYPQGSQNSVIQYSMLIVFIVVFVCFSISLFLVLNRTYNFNISKHHK